MISTGNSALRKETTRNMTDAAMLLLLRRLPMDDVTFCAFRRDSRADDSREQATETMTGLQRQSMYERKMGSKLKNWY
jgi:hypothetical protein